MDKKSQWENSRNVMERIFIHGTLTLKTPAHFGNGDAEGLTDIPLLYDPLDGRTPLLTGASVAGALRNYLREFERGYGWTEERGAPVKSLAERLFGHLDKVEPEDSRRVKESTVESWLFVDDARGTRPAQGDAVELRDGVAIDAATRTVEEDERGGHKYDYELLAAGTTFPLSLEFWRTAKNGDLLPALATALKGLEEGELGLGMRKRRGLGECTVTDWRVDRHPMDNADGLFGWLNHRSDGTEPKPHITDWMAGLPEAGSRRDGLQVDAWFELDGSLLIRSGTGAGSEPDMVHLQSWRAGKAVPILSGTSAAGAIRNRALRIANTVLERNRGADFVDAMFGRRLRDDRDEKADPTGSHVLVRETTVENGIDNLVQSRVKIDRFTGGAFPQALFAEKPVWGQAGAASVHIQMTLIRPNHVQEPEFFAQAGLLMLVLKDLWTGDLPLGGESSVGRGRLRGKSAVITRAGKPCKIERMDDNTLSIDGREEMDKWVEAFHGWKDVAPKGESKDE